MELERLSALISAVITFLLLIVLARFSWHKKNYVVGASLVPLLVQISYYLILYFGIEPLASSEVIRVYTIRPAVWVFFFLMIVFFANGSVNHTIDLIINKIKKYLDSPDASTNQ